MIKKNYIEQEDDKSLCTLYNKQCVSDLKCFDPVDFAKEMLDNSLIPKLNQSEI